MIEDDLPEVSDDALFGDVVQIIMSRGKQHLQEEQERDGPRHAVEQFDIFIDLDHIHQFFHEQGDHQIDGRDQYQKQAPVNDLGFVRD